MWPHRVTIVGRLEATLPADDEQFEFRPVTRAAGRAACPGAAAVESGIRFLGPRRWLVLVRCSRPSTAPVAGVLVTFVDVRVPDLLGPVFPQLQGVTNRLGLRLRVHRRQGAGDAPTAVVTESPRPGTVLPFETAVRITISG